MEFEIKKFDITIRDIGNYTDWFCTEFDKTKDVHKTLLKVYVNNDIFLFEKLVPINFENIEVELVSYINDTFNFHLLTYYFPEMRIKSNIPIDRLLFNGDKVHVNFNILIIG